MINWIAQKILDALRNHQVLVVGVRGSGRRAFLDHLKGSPGGVITTKNIIANAFDDNRLSFQGSILFDITNYGGDPSRMWKDNTAGTAGVVCVVDSADETKIEQTKVALSEFYEGYGKLLSKSVLLVLANKQDRLGALSVAEVKDRLELESRFEGRRWHIQGCDVVSGEGLQEGVDWMGRQI